MADVLVLDTIATLRSFAIPSDVDAIFVKAYSQPSSGNPTRTRGGGLFQRVPSGVTPPFLDDSVFTFLNSPVAPNPSSYWTRNLNGGVVDAYMAGAIGNATLNADGTGGGSDDSIPINAFLAAVFKYANNRANSLEVRFALGDGTFYVTQPLWTGPLPTTYHSWVVEGTGTTILGACAKAPILDLTDRRFGTVRNLQIVGLVDATGLPISSCGIRVGRNEDNGAANQMTMDHVGIRGHFHLAGMLNIASEQFAAIGCEFANDAEGDKYGYAADGFNCLQWSRSINLTSVSNPALNTFDFVSDSLLLNVGDNVIVRGQFSSVLDAVWFTVTSVTDATHFRATGINAPSAGITGGKLYKKLYGGADPLGTPGLTPWQQNSFKQQYHQQGNYRAPRGTAGILETCDSQHIYQMVHPTCGYYPDATATGVAAAKAVVTGVTTGAITKITVSGTQPFVDRDLVSFYFLENPFGDRLNTRLFKAKTVSATEFELRDLEYQPIDSTGWATGAVGAKAVAIRQKVAGNKDARAGGFGMRILVSSDAGCDVSSYLIHHEAGSFTAKDPNDSSIIYAGETTWWASVESFQGWRDQGTTGFTPSPVVLSDVSFSEAAAHGRGGFLLAQRDTTSGVTMLGGKVALTHASQQFGGLSPADRLLTSTGTGDSLWTLSNTDLVVDEAALVDVTRLAGFSGRLTAEDAAFAYGLTIGYPGAVAVLRTLAGGSQASTAMIVRRYDALLGALDRAGVLTRLDALYVFAAPGEVAARINLAKPGSGPLAFAGTLAAPPFVAWQRYTGAGATGQYFVSPLGPSAQSQYQLNQAMMSVVSRTTSGTAVSYDVSLGSTFAYVDPWSGATPQFRSKANEASPNATTPTGVSSPAGFFAWSRTGPTTYAKYFGAGSTDLPATLAVSSTATGSLPTTGFEVLRGGTHQVSAAVFGGKLTQTEMNALYAALKTYLTAVGAWV